MWWYKIMSFSRHYCSTRMTIANTNERDILLYTKYRSMVLIGLNRPDTRNALDTNLVNRLESAITDFENDEEAAVAIIFGEGGNFCAGYDLKELNEKKVETIPPHFVHNKLTERYVKKPLIAAINGYAVGAGFDIALWCDLRVMDETCIVGCLSRRYGMTMSESAIGRLQAIVGFSKAMEILLIGEPIKCDEAKRLNICNRVAPCGTSVGLAITLASELCKYPQAGSLTDRATLYKHAYSKIPLKNSVIDTESMIYKAQVIEDVKVGSELFADGVGKHAKLFSTYHWKGKE